LALYGRGNELHKQSRYLIDTFRQHLYIKLKEVQYRPVLTSLSLPTVSRLGRCMCMHCFGTVVDCSVSRNLWNVALHSINFGKKLTDKCVGYNVFI
jgi:hypothetical protein